MKLEHFHSVILNPERCIGCTYCLKICPTEAIRLKNSKASIIDERCIDCGECIRVCPDHAKSAITDSIDIIKNFKYTIAVTLPVLYGQFTHLFPPSRILSALKTMGFDEVIDTSIGSKAVAAVCKTIISGYRAKPVINSSCPAIVRLIQVRFPELLDNILDIETPAEISARLIKIETAKKTGIPINDIGVILITPCTAMATSVKNPLGTNCSYIDGTISIKDVYAPMLKALASEGLELSVTPELSSRDMFWYNAGGQLTCLEDKNTLSVDGINNAISVLEEVELGRLNNLSFIEIAACPGGCLGGPLIVENRYIALNNMRNMMINLPISTLASLKNEEVYLELYKNGFIRLTEKILPRSIMSLDKDLKKSIEKMDGIQSILSNLPGIDCGICGSPTCRAFAEDIVTGNRSDIACPVLAILKKNSNSN